MKGKDWIKISHEHDALVGLEKMLISMSNIFWNLHYIKKQQEETSILRDDEYLKKMMNGLCFNTTMLVIDLETKREDAYERFYTLLGYE